MKYWLSLSDEEQRRRFQARIEDPAKRWKLSPMDLEAQARWVDYAEAKDQMFAYTDIKECPWYVVDADDKQSARLNLIAHLLSTVPFEPVELRADQASCPAGAQLCSAADRDTELRASEVCTCSLSPIARYSR